MSKNKQIKAIIDNLKELVQDTTVPKNIKTKVQNVIKVLQEKSELSIKINKVLQELDEISDDPNLEPYTRTQIWNVVSVLEKL
jgi:uncharacterized protein (UPF0147 family)